jgi:tetratricopeptide (TPR) repeat protein
VAEQRKGIASLAAGLFEAALGHFEKSLSFDPTNEVSLMGRADALTGMGESEKSEQLLRDVLSKDEDYLPAAIRLARLYISQKRYAEAGPLVNLATHMAGENVTVLALRTELAMGTEDYHGAVTALERITMLRPDDANAHFELASAYLLVQRLPAAEETLLKALKLDPGHGKAAQALAQIYLVRGETDAATTWFRRAFDSGVRTPAVCLSVATHAMRSEQYDLALATLKDAVERYPEDIDLADTLARMYAMCPDGRYRDWEAAHRIVTDIYGTDDRAMPIRGLNTTAAVHAEAGNFDEAIRLTREAIERSKLEGNSDMLRVLSQNLKLYEDNRRLYQAPNP